MRLRQILPEDEADDLPDDWPPFAYVPGMGDVYQYGTDPEHYYRLYRGKLRPGEYVSWWSTVVQRLEPGGDQEVDSSVADYVRTLRRAGYDTHSCCSGDPHDHPLQADRGELPEGYLALARDGLSERVARVAEQLGLRTDQIDDAYGSDRIIRIKLGPADWPKLVQALVN